MSPRHAILMTYRRLLNAAKDYPSTRRLSIIQEIRVAFREDAHHTDPTSIEKCLAEAKEAENQLNRFPKDTRDNADLEYTQR